MKSFSLFFVSFFLVQLACANSVRTLCRHYQNASVEADACLNIPDNWDQKQIVYHLHGIRGSENTWMQNKYYQQAMTLLDRQKVQRPLVVTISFGPWWLLKDFNVEGQPAYLEMAQKIFAQTEQEIFKDRAPQKRILMGESMGGYNSLLLLSKGKIQFDKAALLCPGFAKIGPFSTNEDIQAYINRQKAYIDPNRVMAVIGLLRKEFPTTQLWEAHAPLTIVQNLKGLKTEFYVTGNTRDEYGFGEGAEYLKEEMTKLGVNFKYEKIDGGHCVMKTQSLVNFLKP